MNGWIKIKDIIKDKNRLTVLFDVSNDLKKFFYEFSFWVEYDFSVDKIDDSILIIPFLANIIPICWITNSKIIIDSIDEDFYNSIEEFKKGYVSMYPKIKFYKTNIVYNKIISNKLKKDMNRVVLFSGGVDAFTTLYSHLNEFPILVTIWGADIPTNNTDAWCIMKKKTLNVGKKFDLKNQFIKSNFKEFLCTKELNLIIIDSNDKWWHGFQHGIGLISLAAPLCYLYNVDILYIASSYTKNDKNVTCASYPTIDERISFSNVRVIHDQFELNRQEKINKIVSISKEINKFPELHVCWENSTGINCCKCEKCCRTMLGLMIENESPEKYGFKKCNGKFIKKRMLYYNKIDRILFPLWNDMIKKFKDNKEKNKFKSEIEWIEDLDLYNRHFFMKKVLRKVDELIERIRKNN